MVAIDNVIKDVKESAPRPPQDMNLVPEGDNPDLPIEAIEGDPEKLFRRREYDRISHDINISIERRESPSMGSSEQLYTASQWQDITKRCARASQEAIRIDRNLQHQPNVELPLVLPRVVLTTLSASSSIESLSLTVVVLPLVKSIGGSTNGSSTFG